MIIFQLNAYGPLGLGFSLCHVPLPLPPTSWLEVSLLHSKTHVPSPLQNSRPLPLWSSCLVSPPRSQELIFKEGKRSHHQFPRVCPLPGKQWTPVWF